MTDKEFFTFCQQNPDLKIEQDKHGNIIIMSPVSLDSGNHESEVLTDLNIWNRQNKPGKTYSSSTLFILPDGEKRMPDAAWVANKKINKLSKKERKSFAHIIPDFVIEVSSPSDNIEDLKKKMTEIWMANGVQLAWLIHPKEEISWVYQAGKETEEIKGFDKILSGRDVLPGFNFDLSILKDG